MVDNQPYMRNPLRIFSESEMDAVILNDKVRTQMAINHHHHQMWSANRTTSGPAPMTPGPASRQGPLGLPDLNSLPLASLPFFNPPTSLANVINPSHQMYAMNSANRAINSTSAPSNIQLPLPAQFWSQWSTLHGLGLGLNHLGLLGLGFGTPTDAANHTSPLTSPQAASTPISSVGASGAGGRAAMSSSASPNYHRYSPYSIKRSPSPNVPSPPVVAHRS